MNKWHKTFLQMASLVAQNHSKDPSTKVGAVIAKDSYPLSFGYNGLIRDYPDSKEILNDRETKLIYTVHAEYNAILNAVRNHVDIRNAILYTTHEPCYECMKAIVQSGIKEVITVQNVLSSKWKESLNISRDIASQCGIRIIKYNSSDVYE